MATILNWNQVERRIKLIKESLGLSKDQDAFSYLCLDLILDIDIDEIPSLITDGSNDHGIDAIHFEENSDGTTIHLFSFKYTSKFEKVKSNFPLNETDKIRCIFENILSKDESIKKSCNPILFDKISNIWDIIEKSDVYFIIHLCSNMSPLDSGARSLFFNWIKKFKVIELREHHLESISDEIVGKSRVIVDGNLKMFGDQCIEHSNGYLRGLTITARAIDIIELITDKDYKHHINKNIFYENIREHLGENNSVNSKILESATARNNFEFWYLNNGITIVSDSFTYIPKLLDAPIRMKNLQIVNGGQTSYTLFKAATGDSEKLKDVKILVKIIQTSDREITSKIAEATNSQTPIRSRDIRSNDIIQLKLESALNEMGYFYERKRYQHLGRQKSKIIDSLKVGKSMLAYYLRMPDKAKTASNQIFGELYDLIFDDSISANRVLTAHKLVEEIERRRNDALLSLRESNLAKFSEHWLTEGLYHVLYQMSLICERDRRNLEIYDEAVLGIEEAIKTVDEFFSKQERASAYRVFRSATTKRELYIASGQQLSLL
ncbi:hypothetical protein CHU95_07425 [Niveispirillum lacus]|uniref:Abortive phage infection protein C-terminal domain-containing protein n=1 Tax=Niveispirillum lacus TaxID=1981099 RepID=A0A255Z290_9PROT|nr:AIPR family protein [Niveispirillum lacus]OYQ35549.1 hypothetical protein CHU95_07425 [Niveispirillum lacus]